MKSIRRQLMIAIVLICVVILISLPFAIHSLRRRSIFNQIMQSELRHIDASATNQAILESLVPELIAEHSDATRKDRELRERGIISVEFNPGIAAWNGLLLTIELAQSEQARSYITNAIAPGAAFPDEIANYEQVKNQERQNSQN